MEHANHQESHGAQSCHHDTERVTFPQRAQTSVASEYTCPMHPEVIRNAPGDCPKCGMALEPVTPDATADDNTELRDMNRRFWVSAILTVPVFFLSLGELIPGVSLGSMASPRSLDFLELFLVIPVIGYGAWPFFKRFWRSLVNRALNMFTLIGMGVGVAFLYSLIAVLAPGLFPASFRGPDGQVAVYFEAAAVITVLVLLGQVLELKARSQTSAAIKALLGLAPKTARRLSHDGGESDVPLDQVEVGDRIRVRPGEKVPVDGTVAAIEVEAGQVVGQGDLLVEIDPTGGDEE